MKPIILPKVGKVPFKKQTTGMSGGFLSDIDSDYSVCNSNGCTGVDILH